MTASNAKLASPSVGSGRALGAGLCCYLIWGFLPLALQAAARQGAGSWEVLAHRILWGAPLALAFVLAARQGPAALRAFANLRLMAWLTLSTILIAVNWSTFIWAVTSGRVLESSLGYYIVPLINMAAGALLFRERVDRIGAIAISLAILGVAVQAVALGHLPVVSLALGFSFGAYGVVRKHAPVTAQTGLLIECLLLAPFSLGYVLWLAQHGQGHFGPGQGATGWLLLSGPFTALPLMLFAWAARRIPLSAMGFLQFITPTMTFALGVSQGEAFTPLRAVAFVFIWTGAATFLFGAWRRARRLPLAAAAPPPAD